MQLTELAFFTRDVPAMPAFYRRLLGAAPMVEAERRTMPEVDGACEALAAQGLTVTVPPRDYDWGRSAYLRDPDGHLIELTQAAGV